MFGGFELLVASRLKRWRGREVEMLAAATSTQGGLNNMATVRKQGGASQVIWKDRQPSRKSL